MGPSPPTAAVVRLLEAMLGDDFPGAVELREQLAGLTVRPGCTCGCGTLDLNPRQSATPSPAISPVPVEETVLDGTGSPVGGLLLFVVNGYLDSLEVYDWDEPLALPEPSQVRWKV